MKRENFHKYVTEKSELVSDMTLERAISQGRYVKLPGESDLAFRYRARKEMAEELFPTIVR